MVVGGIIVGRRFSLDDGGEAEGWGYIDKGNMEDFRGHAIADNSYVIRWLYWTHCSNVQWEILGQSIEDGQMKENVIASSLSMTESANIKM